MSRIEKFKMEREGLVKPGDKIIIRIPKISNAFCNLLIVFFITTSSLSLDSLYIY